MTEPSAPAGTAALLGDLTAAQRQAVETDAAPLCVLASAGAGKTRVVTRRIAYRVATGSADARHVLALTFTRKAAAELGERVMALGLRERITAGTFHSVAAAQLRQWWRDRGVAPAAVLASKARLVSELASQRPTLAGAGPAALAGEIEWAKARLVAPADFEDASRGRDLPAPAADIASLYQRYQHELTRRGLIDFDDLLARCAAALQSDPAFAAAQRWRWRHLFVDEYQDLNPLQFRLLRGWLGPGVDLCAVGDPHQAIYGWNGADPGLLAAFSEHWPGATVLRLDDNHRCTPQVVAAAAAVLGPAAGGLRSSRADGPPPAVIAYPSDRAEARGAAAEVRAARHRGLPWSQMAVLVRTNAQAGAFRDAFRAAGIPHRVTGAAALLDEPAVQQALEDLRRRRTLPFPLLAADLSTAAGDPGAGSAPALSRLADLAREFASVDAEATADGFLAWLPAAGGEDTAEGDGAVTISSFHRAKGLEWEAVWVCGLERGLVPLTRAASAAAEAEERRLLYVALTRAQRELHCSWAETRHFGARGVPRDPSPWLAAIDLAAGAAPNLDTSGPDEWRQRLAEQRQALRSARRAQGRPRRRGGAGPASEPSRGDGAEAADRLLMAELRAWRAQRARAAGVPAHVLLHDRTIEALATRRPGDEEALLAVPGMGPVKVARFGPQLLALLGAHRASA